MSDRTNLVIPDPTKRIVTPDEAARLADRHRKYDAAGKRVRPPGGFMDEKLTREEAMTHVATAVAEAVRLAMEEQDEALGDRLEQMESVITQNVLLRIERRTWRYRAYMWLRASWLGPYLMEIGILRPAVQLARPVDPVEALDPNVQQRAGRMVRTEVTPNIDDPNALMWRSEPQGFTGELAAWLAEGNRVAIARHPKTHDWFLMAHDTPTLERAARMIGGENPTFEDGVTSAQLNDEFTARAFYIINHGGEPPEGGWRE